jgi:hypothetical protein
VEALRVEMDWLAEQVAAQKQLLGLYMGASSIRHQTTPTPVGAEQQGGIADRVSSRAPVSDERFPSSIAKDHSPGVHQLLGQGFAGCSCGQVACPTPASHPMGQLGPPDATTDPQTLCYWWGLAHGQRRHHRRPGG